MTEPVINTPPVDPGDAHGVGATVLRPIDPSLQQRDAEGKPVVQTFPPRRDGKA